eukprot:TRINITY_DN3458_c0_g1_i1.p1 TRINITY_DN3458_c0_g1~~TRINITY_DN3458_c0_g1_i1.p1  ORF type:complete len:504 (+),score=149.31 TRINITY_DN3458_c0_g1_i1:335-1846(+)
MGIEIVGFLKWLRDNKVADVENIKIEQSGEAGLGLFAAKDIKKGQVAFNVPPNIILSTYAVWEHPKLKAFFKKPQIASSESLLLMLFLISEQYNSSSFWYPYISMMPKSYTLPFFWTFDDFKFLEGSSLLIPAVWNLISVARYYHTVFMSLAELSYPINPFEFTWDRFIWAYGTVYTRQNRIPNMRNADVRAAAQKLTDALLQKVTGLDAEQLRKAEAADGSESSEPAAAPVADDSPYANQEYVMALIPLFDMCNHEPVNDPSPIARGSSEEFDFNNGGMPVRPIKDTKKGEEINIFYGLRHTSDFVLANGFVPQPSNLDAFTLPCRLNQADPLIEAKVAALIGSGHFEALASMPKPASVPVQLVVNRNRIQGRTMFFFRVLAAQDEKLLKETKAGRFRNMVENDVAFEDNDTELRALMLYSLRIQQQLNRFPADRVAELEKKLAGNPAARSAQPPVQKLLAAWLKREELMLNDVLKMVQTKMDKKKKKIASSKAATPSSSSK